MRETLRAAVSRALLPGAPPRHPGPIRVPSDPPEHLLERFRSQLTALGGDVHETATPEGVADLIVSLASAEAERVASEAHAGRTTFEGSTVPGFQGSRVREPARRSARDLPSTPGLLMWNADQLPIPGVDTALARAPVRLIFQMAADMSSLERRRDLATAVVGVTGAHAGLAETGSLVLASGPGRSRLASLLPPIHVALLDRRLIVQSLPDLVALRPELMTAGANVVCITGPSRTADIEHTLTRGVHGPREVHVIVVN
jgi:hypothetical protein